METLLQWDNFLFSLINGTWSNSFFDALLPLLRTKEFWAPLYIFVLAYIAYNYSWKQALILIAFTALAAGLADFTRSSIIKPYFNRLRPCNSPWLQEQIHLLVPCGSGKSFTSSHAANHFALAWCWIMIWGRQYRWLIPVLLLWAASIAYSQVYVGVHFPFDVLAGGLLGTAVGIFCGSMAQKALQRHQAPPPATAPDDFG
ncbi:MAG: phosphatase PAP2 family protein [Sphingobacteriales bacterium]|nr:phosphatase PAP2 family protein [Sphingobacteriales bacterium]